MWGQVGRKMFGAGLPTGSHHRARGGGFSRGAFQQGAGLMRNSASSSILFPRPALPEQCESSAGPETFLGSEGLAVAWSDR
jgi:hypothetical protein